MKHLGMGSSNCIYLIAIEHPIGLAIEHPVSPFSSERRCCRLYVLVVPENCLAPIRINDPNKKIQGNQ